MMRLAAALASIAASGSVWAAAGGNAAPRFAKAVPVWTSEYAGLSNVQVRFSAKCPRAGAATVRLAGADAYRVEVNGEFAHYGPARAAKGFFRVDEIDVRADREENDISVVAQWSGCRNYYFPSNEAFLQAEVVADGKVVAATGAGGGFSAFSTDRVLDAPRYSSQRGFAEIYRVGSASGSPLPLEERPRKNLLERIAPMSRFELNRGLRLMACSTGRVAADGGVALPAGAFARIDAGMNDCGFFGFDVDVGKPGRLRFVFDEVLTEGKVDFRRMACHNVLEWVFDRPGRYRVETFEPYVWRYGDLSAEGGEFAVSDLHVRRYWNGEVGRASFHCSDPALERIFDAAVNTFAHNAVDVFTDCPGRERAGWLCDSFFTGRVNALLCGNCELERLFLQNYALPKSFDNLPAGMFPMCYPASYIRGRFIPNWAMWLVLETEEYLARSGDRQMVDAMRPKFEALVGYLKTFMNSDGLLEKLPSWVFVEWSHANSLVQDVNYPSNMTFAEVLDAMDRLYSMPELAAEARRMRETIRRQSWTGRWFSDNAVRGADGSLKTSGECTETCQYYAFFFHVATPETHRDLWRSLVADFGPSRRATGKFPEIWPSNAFIGNYLRLELLSRNGLSGKVMDETKGFFLGMAERTGTLWENDTPSASCDHGFASHAAVGLFRDVLGLRRVDYVGRKVWFEPPAGTGLSFCRGTLPVSPTEEVSAEWTVVDGVVQPKITLPAGWRQARSESRAEE